MATDIAVRPFDPADDALRQKNAAAAEAFLRLTGADSPRRLELFAPGEEISCGRAFTKEGSPDVARGREAVARFLAQMAADYPVQAWEAARILVCADPNYLIAETDLYGTGHRDDLGDYPHGGHVIHTFVMEDGRVKDYLWYDNPARELVEMGFALPGPGGEE
ncbi:PhzA/PhzB family protein [Bittarella massiliensis (ex Durand et al. 2017)]|uniref:PhzA/PhzB family protein n=1 Tax=Bittarella massiliensis (ex Durand et al. 2017) TaxID=1720313 RepID=UPI001AA0F802|nr:PhzA/PhzB family protein [Bittarella massiliensis (ex Durand et al. 2017)]MBO1678786.1 SnoaL-like domain-containing protein [Bittarella massiliensis (ex Durand et al. 2017)]